MFSAIHFKKKRPWLSRGLLPNLTTTTLLYLLRSPWLFRASLEFNAIIQSSTLVQYCLACKAAGVIDNPQSPLSYGERLEALKKREDAWRKLKPAFETTIKINDLPSTLYELSAGNYFLSDINRRDLYYCRLPSSPQDDPQWCRIPGHGPGQSWSGSIIEMGMAVYEHDLVVNVICSQVQVGNHAGMRRNSLDLVLLKFSTGEYHPLARLDCPKVGPGPCGPWTRPDRTQKGQVWVSSKVDLDPNGRSKVQLKNMRTKGLDQVQTRPDL
ncbi:hypothetical protein JOM56_007918 [Amanita muscaria]